MIKKISLLLNLIQIFFWDLQVFRVIVRVNSEKLSYLSISALLELYQCVKDIETKKLEGIFIEAGCALGGSALVIASSKSPSRTFLIFDTFKGIPPPSRLDGNDAHKRYEDIMQGKAIGKGGKIYYGYRSHLIDEIKDRFIDFGYPIEKNYISLIEGYYKDTIMIDQPVAFAHIDSDWYESVFKCLGQIWPNLISGGTMIIDDYNKWSGCKKAVDDYFVDKRNEQIMLKKSRLHIIKK